MQDDIAIKVEHISKAFKEQAGARSVKQGFVSLGRKVTGKKEKRIGKGEFTALKDINFEVKKGEFFGIVGRNGSGKSTLLKIIAGVYTPTKGAVTINGKLTPFIELGVGFNPELSGRDNVYLNAALLGFTRKQTDTMYEDIVDFAELKDFMDVKLKNYSSGMQVRLAFSVAIRAESDILLIDEVLAVGDAAFQQKCYEYFERLKLSNKTVIFVSHDMSAVRQFCERAILINYSRLEKNGTPSEVAKLYEKINYDKSSSAKPDDSKNTTVTIQDEKGGASSSFKPTEKINININWDARLGKKVGIVGVSIISQGAIVFATNSINQKDYHGKNNATLEINQELGNGRYSITVGLFGETRHDCIAMLPDIANFQVYGNEELGPNSDEWFGVIYIDNKWRG